MKIFMYRNHKTGMEIKLKEAPDEIPSGYTFMKVYDLSVSDKEKKAK